jgi:hypothetical protein
MVAAPLQPGRARPRDAAMPSWAQWGAPILGGSPAAYCIRKLWRRLIREVSMAVKVENAWRDAQSTAKDSTACQRGTLVMCSLQYNSKM